MGQNADVRQRLSHVRPYPHSRHSITANNANALCRRQIEKSPLAQIAMSLSTVLVGEFWADDGDCDEPDGDRPDERVGGSGCEQDQDDGSRVADGSGPASGVSVGEGLPFARSCSAGFAEAGQAEQPLLRFGCTRYGDVSIILPRGPLTARAPCGAGRDRGASLWTALGGSPGRAPALPWYQTALTPDRDGDRR